MSEASFNFYYFLEIIIYCVDIVSYIWNSVMWRKISWIETFCKPNLNKIIFVFAVIFYVHIYHSFRISGDSKITALELRRKIAEAVNAYFLVVFGNFDTEFLFTLIYMFNWKYIERQEPFLYNSNTQWPLININIHPYMISGIAIACLFKNKDKICLQRDRGGKQLGAFLSIKW